MPITHYKTKEHIPFIRLVLYDIHNRHCRSGIGVFIVNKVGKISSVGHKIEGKIHIEQYPLVVFLRIHPKRQYRQQNKETVDIQNRCGVKHQTMIRQTQVF